jgi:hypothetical protein
MGRQRGISRDLLDDADFQAAGDDGRLLYFYVRCTLPEYGIGVVRLDELLKLLGPGWGRQRVADAYAAARHFVLKEGSVSWIRNALANEPSFSMGNERHVAGLLNRLSGLPRLAIVRQFVAYYGLVEPAPVP